MNRLQFGVPCPPYLENAANYKGIIMAINVEIQDRSARMVLPARFNRTVNRDFKVAYTPLLDNLSVHEIELDFSAVVYIDSSALGMLLQLRETASRVNKPIWLLNVFGLVLKAFEVTQLSRIFNLRQVDICNSEEKFA